MDGRLRCVIHGCARSRKQNKVRKIGEWLCTKHWKMVEPRLRLRHKKAQRFLRSMKFGPRPFFQAVGQQRWKECKDDVRMKLAMGVSTDGRFSDPPTIRTPEKRNSPGAR